MQRPFTNRPEKMTMTEAERSSESEQIIRDVCGVLRYHRSAGIDSYPRTEAMTALLRLRPGLPSAGRAIAQPAPAADSGKAGKQKTGGQRELEVEDRASLADVRGEVEVCTACGLSQHRVVPVAGEGDGRARLLVVGDWLALEGSGPVPAGCLFGVEQDRMLGKMLEAIKLPPAEVFVTNVIKCGVPADCQPRAEHVHACLSFLQRQIMAVNPEAILCMGLIATRALLDRREPLSSLRGQVHNYLTPDKRQIPLIATYHPSFLLQNPEMKKATWFDLQLLARQIGIQLS